MIKREELSNPNSCMSRAREDEMTFVLLGRDVATPAAIRAWIAERVRLGKNKPNDQQLVEAAKAARLIEIELAADHNPRKPKGFRDADAASLSPDQAHKMMGGNKVIGRASFYAGLKRGEIPHQRIGRRIIIPKAAFIAFLNRTFTGEHRLK